METSIKKKRVASRIFKIFMSLMTLALAGFITFYIVVLSGLFPTLQEL
ncbi:MAG: hypothetical protein MJ246_03900 [Clostridia bacterium]|nr:hypothetical protein [Clostridia bacterium]